MKINCMVTGLTTAHKTHDPYRMCRELGIYVLYHPLLEMRGFAQIEDGVRIVHIAAGLPEWVDAFVCAHELGHLLLHGGMNRLFMDSRTFMRASKYEEEADRFACRLLYTNAASTETTVLDWQIAECLNVPVAAVRRRLAQFGAG